MTRALLVAAAGVGAAACVRAPAVRVDDPARSHLTGRALAAEARAAVAPGEPEAPQGAVAGPWHTHLGNFARTGVRQAPGIADPRVVWAARVGIQGYANTPLVDGDGVYVTSQGDAHDQPDGADGFYGLEARTGAQRWFTPTPGDVNGATLVNGRVVGGGDDGTLWAVDAADGRVVWSVRLDTSHRHGPLFDGERLWVAMRSGYALLDPDTGATVGLIGTASSHDPDVRGASAFSGDDAVRVAPDGTVGGMNAPGDAWRVAATDANAVAAIAFGPPLAVAREVTALTVEWAETSAAQPTIVRVVDRALAWHRPVAQRFQGLAEGATSYAPTYYGATPWPMDGLMWLPLLHGPGIGGFRAVDGALTAVVPLPGCLGRQFASIVGVPSRAYLARTDGSVVAFSPRTAQLTWVVDFASPAAVGRRTDVSIRNHRGDHCDVGDVSGAALFATPALGEDGTLFVGTGSGFLYAVRDAGW